MNSLRIKEIVCVVLLLVFIIVLASQNKSSNADPQTVFERVCAAADTDGLQERGNSIFSEQFGVSESEFAAVHYLASDEVMDVREILVIRLNDGQSADTLLSQIKSRMNDKTELFDGYAPEQSALLKKYRLEEKSGFVLLYVGEDAAKAARAFRRAV